MKLGKSLTGLVVGLLLAPGVMHAQQQAAPPEKPAMTHLRVDIVLAEYNGEKKISSLPYTIYIGVGDANHSMPAQSVRMGISVPIAIAGGFHYQDVGTDIDCQASSEGEERYRIEVKINRTSIYSSDDGSSGGEQIHVGGGQPITRRFNSQFELGLRDGETGEGISATDPFNGHVLKVSVTIHVVK